ncbi:unnamed protein product [Durusdinium trenchii]|uniref:Uncharacterized protein n=2 Tax=Durusdinium trenchii TaxID=1381693 RepID=A0ABP0I1G2_9DINO
MRRVDELLNTGQGFDGLARRAKAADLIGSDFAAGATRHGTRGTSQLASFLPELQQGVLSRARSSFSEAKAAAEKAAIIQDQVEQAQEAAEEAEEEAEAAEEAELIVVGIATVFAGVAWYTTYLTWQMYQRWLNMKKRTALCVGAARAANAVSER